MKRVPPLLLSLLLALVVGRAFPQCNELIPLDVVNPGFEGPTAPHITPAPWSTCGITPDTQPGSWGITLPPSEGSSYVGFVHDGGTWQEGASQQLSGSMQAGVRYDFTIDLAATDATGGGLNPNSHCTMEVWGANALCARTELLWSSPLVTHLNWETYTVSITPTSNWTHIYFICNCAPYGYILLDNITPLQANNPNVFITSHVDGDAETCGFTLAGTINDAIIDSVILTGNFQGAPLAATLVGLDWSAPITFNGPGNQTITATAYYTDQQLQPTCVSAHVDLVINSPISDFTFIPQCDGIAIPFTDASVPFGSSTIAEWNWNFGDGNTSDQQNPTHLYSGPGTYTVELEITSSDGCSVTSSQDVTVMENPVAEFTFNEACEGDTTGFTDNATTATATITTWAWDFDDGNSSTVQNPTNAYSTLGVYAVQLTVTTTEGCSNSITHDVGMYPLPIADFTAVNACLNSLTQFSDATAVSSGNIATWDWDFGDGNTSAVQNPSNLYATDGTFSVTLTTVTDHACTDNFSQTITVNPLPAAAFTSTTVCAQTATAYTDASTVTSGSITDNRWFFGDGNTGTQQNPTHVFAVGGTYTTSLIVTSDLGCEDSVAMDVTVYPKPMAEFQPTDACLNEESTFTDQSTVSGSTVNAWQWRFGDGTGTSTAQNPAYVYGASGQFTAELIATTADGCADTISHGATVFDLPVANFTFVDICEDDSIRFTDQSTVPTGTITSWLWDFGNGNSSMQAVAPFQTYAADGAYTVSLIAGSGAGCADTIEKTIEIFPVPLADFTFDSVCFPLKVQFTDLSAPNGPYDIATWQWQFSDGQTSATQHPQIDFGMPGEFSATLLIANAPGCKGTRTKGNAVVHPLPVAQFPTDMATCLKDTILFTDLSVIAPITDDVITQWRWNLDNGNILTAQNGIHIFSSPGLYNVNLNVTTNHQCMDDVTHVVEIYPLPQINFIAEPPLGCAPLAVQFLDQTTITSPYALASWEWSLGVDTLPSDERSPFQLYDPEMGPLDMAQFDIALTVTSANGCVSSVLKPKHITVYPKPIAAFAASPDVQNIVDPQFHFTDLSTPNVTIWDWSFGDGDYGSAQHPVHYYDAPGSYPIELIVETYFGCKDTTAYKVKVEPIFTFYIPNSFTPDDDGINDQFFGQGEGYSSYSFVIYDRWGEKIFESNSDQFHWDGTYKGKQVQQGTYAYRFYVMDWQNRSHEYVGHVTLHR